jgi:uncharacterized protein
MDKNLIRQITIDQRAAFAKTGDFIVRSAPDDFVASKKISVISGIRRSGKSTLLKQISEKLSSYSYLNFEDERMLDFTYRDFNSLYEIFLELYGEQKYYLFDEIQNIHGWEKFARRLFEDGKKVFVTGSNAKLLSSELATSLSGRYIKRELYPFSFKEFLDFKKFISKEYYDTKEKAVLIRYLNEYLEHGGFPEIVTGGNKKDLQQLYQDILVKDLLVRFKIRETKSFREVALFLLSNISSPISFGNVRKLLGIKSVTTVKSYIDFFEEAYLFFTVYKFDYSVKKQIINDRKIYCIDTGLFNAVAFRFSQNLGKSLENAVFLELKRRGKEIYYYKDKKECDFILREDSRITELIQVSYEIGDPKTRQREIEGLLAAKESYKTGKAYIITLDQEESLEIDGVKIKIVPLWKWLLE